MEPRTKRSTRVERERELEPTPTEQDYDLATPLWAKYYEAMRKRVRFPRYYKKALNW